MRRIIWAILLTSLAPLASAQVTVGIDDLGYGLGSTRTYSTHLAETWPVDGIILGTGGPQVWDFSSGPDDETYQQEVFQADEADGASEFPDAELVERSQYGSLDQPGWTFYRLTDDGRELHGFDDPIASPGSPIVKLDPAIIDFQEVMSFGAVWTTSTSFESVIDLTDTPGLGKYPAVSNVEAQLEVDAYGTMWLPDLGEIDVLRINELTTTTSTAFVEGNPVALGDAYVRSFYWVSPGLGIVAQITSTASSPVLNEPFPDNEFETAARFLRLTGGDSQPEPEIGIEVEVIGDFLSLSWEAVPGATVYEVLTSESLADESWQVLAAVGATQFVHPMGNDTRFYKVEVAEPE